jgi:hypothetical protein
MGEAWDVSEIKMFGGLAFMADGNMFCGIVRDDLMAHVGPERYDEALKEPSARPMDFAGRPMRGMLFIGPEGYESDDAPASWVGQSLSFAQSLPPKSKGQTKSRRRSTS